MGPLAKLDAGYYRVEKAIVIGALVVMAVTVFLDVVHRRLVAPDSTITRILLLPKRANLRRQQKQAIGGRKKSTAQLDMEIQAQLEPSRRWLNRHVSPLLLGLLVYILVLAAVRTAAGRRHGQDDEGDDEADDHARARDGPSLPRWSYLATLGACVAVSLLLVHLPSGVCWLLLVALVVGGGLLSRRAGPARHLVHAGAISAGLALVAWLMVSVPSRWTYVLLVVLVAGGFAIRPATRSSRRLLATTLGVGAAAALLALLFVPDGFAWAKEVAMQLLLWVGFLGASMASHSRQHIMVDFVRKNVPARYRKYYEGLSALIAAGFCVLLTYLAYLYVFGAPAPMSIYSMDAELDYTGLPSWIGVAAIPLGLATTSLRFLGVSYRAFTGQLEPDESAAHVVAPDQEAESKDSEDSKDSKDSKDSEDSEDTQNGKEDEEADR